MKGLMVHSRPVSWLSSFTLVFKASIDDAADVSMGGVVPIASLVQRGGVGFVEQEQEKRFEGTE